MFNIAVANKEQVKLMVGLTGPSGSGKTYSALQLAFGITKDWNAIALADTENRSSLYYAGEKTGPWHLLDFPPTVQDGYHPRNWIQLISEVESIPGIKCLILDSITHEWQGVGGCLQLVNRYAKNPRNNNFSAWNDVTPLHDSFVDKTRNSRLHIISTIRSKMGYATEKNETNGKVMPKKIGLEPIQRDGLEYEFGVIFDIDISHYATSSKDRTGIFIDRAPFLITPETGLELAGWANNGVAKQNSFTKLIKAFEKFDISQQILEDYLKLPCEQWTDDSRKELNELGIDLKNGVKDREGMLAAISLRDF
jgi:hypothetical protein